MEATNQVKVTLHFTRIAPAYKYACHLCPHPALFGANFIKHLQKEHSLTRQEAKEILDEAAAAFEKEHPDLRNF